jgi:hypothetical protein
MPPETGRDTRYGPGKIPQACEILREGRQRRPWDARQNLRQIEITQTSTTRHGSRSLSSATGGKTMSLGVVRLLGWLVIAHGLSHAVLPMRGSFAPALLIDDWGPVVLYAVGMFGFVAAGLGLLGLRPLDKAISPVLVLASGLSLVAIVRFGDPTLWFGAACDVALLLTGLWRAYGGWPQHPAHGRIWHAAGLMAGFGLLLYVGTAAFLYPWHRTWGSTSDELRMSLPGDPAVRDVGLEVQHAVTIDAPAVDVWAWLVQLGQDRAGFYSYDWLERAFGANIRNVKEIRSEWQARDVGDFVPATQRDYLGGAFGSDLGWTVKAMQPQRALVLENWGAFVLMPTADGNTRFIIRSTISNREIPIWASALNMITFQLPHFIMQRRMMLTIKELAEERRSRRAAMFP